MIPPAALRARREGVGDVYVQMAPSSDDRVASPRLLHELSVLLCALAVAGCAEEEPPPAPPPAQVSFVTVEPRAVTLTQNLPGRVSAYRTAEVRARTSGVVLRRAFTGGERVQAGQLLYEIDPAPLQAVTDRAEAAVQSAEAAAALASSEAERNRRLYAMGAISRSMFENVVTQERAAQAQVESARAALREARVDLGYATVTSPIDGVVGLPLVTEGALVGQGEPTLMALVQEIDQVYVDLQLPAQALSSMRAAGIGDGHPVVIQTGEAWAPTVEGQLLFSDISVDRDTGEVTLRALVDNEPTILLPGQYVRAVVPTSRREEALMVPQQAVQRDPAGQAQLVLLDETGGAERRSVVAGAVVDGWTLIEEGLSAGEKVVVEGQDKLRPGVPIHATPWEPPSAHGPAVATVEP